MRPRVALAARKQRHLDPQTRAVFRLIRPFDEGGWGCMSRPAGGILSGCDHLEDTAATRPLKSRSDDVADHGDDPRAGSTRFPCGTAAPQRCLSGVWDLEPARAPSLPAAPLGSALGA